MKSLICRSDSLRNNVVFVLDSFNSSDMTIDVWRDMTTDKLEKVSLGYYHSTKALPDAKEVILAGEFTKMFKLQEGVVLRRRLFWKTPESVTAAMEAQQMHHTRLDTHSDSFNKGAFAAELLAIFRESLSKLMSEHSHTVKHHGDTEE